MICQYCKAEAKLVSGRRIYPHLKRLHAQMFYLCEPCDAYVGTHRGTDKPLGEVADHHTRWWRQKAHFAFDNLWKGKSNAKDYRIECYAWLASELGLPTEKTHIGMFDVDTCKKVVEAVKIRVGAKHEEFETCATDSNPKQENVQQIQKGELD